MPYKERTDEEIISAYEQWVKKLSESDQDTIILRCLCPSPKKNTWTSKEIIIAMKEKDKCAGLNYIAGFREISKKLNKDVLEWINSWPIK